MENWIDLANLPRTAKGVDWKSCNNNIVHFCYRNTSDSLCVVENYDSEHIIVLYKNKQYILSKLCLQRCCLGKLFNFATTNNYMYKVGDIIKPKYGKLKIENQQRISLKNNKNIKGYNVTCQICGYNFNIQESNIIKGDGCPVCSKHKVLIGHNDLWTIRPDICLDLTNPNDGYFYSQYSNKQVEFTCHNCGNYIGYKTIYDVSISGLSCPKCGDGVSYPNKFMYNLLKLMNIDFDNEVKFPWCKFIKYGTSDVFTFGIYDFVLENKVILEMDSGLGHGNNVYSNSKISLEETIYRDKEKDRLARENGYSLIRVNCFYVGKANKFESCKNGVLNSEFAKKYKLDNIDWKRIDLQCSNSFIVESCKLYNQGLSISEIAQKLKRAKCTIIDYLHKGNELALCEYKTKK